MGKFIKGNFRFERGVIMDKTLEKYLEEVDKYLKPLPTSERIDIVKEIKGSILEMQNENLSTEQILERLGKSKELAKAYLGDLISNGVGFHWNRFLTIFAFYSLIGISGMFVVPTLAIIAPVFIFCGIIIPICGLIKLLGYAVNIEVPFIVFQIGKVTLHPVLGFVFSMVVGVGLIILGRGAWRLLLRYIQNVSKKKKEL